MIQICIWTVIPYLQKTQWYFSIHSNIIKNKLILYLVTSVWKVVLKTRRKAVGSYNLGQNKWKTLAPPPPQIKDGKMARFCPSRGFILDLGGMGVCCSILFCPRLSESKTCVTQSVQYGNHDLKLAVASF